VAELFQALRYKAEARGFDTPMEPWGLWLWGRRSF